MFLLEVVLPLPLDKTFHYLSDEYVSPGIRVIVPFGKQILVGLVWDCKEVRAEDLSPEIDYKKIEDVLDSMSIYPKRLFPLLEWVSNYYLSPLGVVLRTALPAGLLKLPERKVYFTEEGKRNLGEILSSSQLEHIKEGMAVGTFLKRTGLKLRDLKRLQRRGFVEIRTIIPRVGVPKEVFYRLKEIPEKDRYPELLEIFQEAVEVPARTLRERLGANALRKLIRTGLLEKIELPKVRRVTLACDPLRDYELTPSQRAIFEDLVGSLDTDRAEVHLLYGVTGSGKSLIYLELIKEVIKRGKRVLFLLPEIALTHYVERLLFEHFREGVAVLHSALSPGQRVSEWMKLLEGRANIVVGTRSAVFAPIENLGAIIVDEEHDPSYKEENLACKYNARDVAVIRGYFEKTLVLLGSATPSVKSFYFARTSKYRLHILKERPFVALPEVKLIPLRSYVFFEREVLEEIDRTLQSGKSVFVYLNRRGYAPIVRCEDCGYVWSCPNCDIPLNYHKSEGVLLCHYCNFQIGIHTLCPHCGGSRAKFLRFGTERLEEELGRLFPLAKVVRLDRDIVSSQKRLDEILREIYSPYPKIIVGTQMGVHGHNFPQVKLVVILRAEEGLFVPHYKAEERTFQLLLQAEGRAGRKDEQGKVIIQTAFPDHYVIKLALEQDYEKFFQEEISRRRKYGFPPFKRLAVVRLEGVKEEKVMNEALRIKNLLEEKRKGDSKIEVLGPSPAPLRKLRGLHRWHILLKANRARDLIEVLGYLREMRLVGVRLEIDIDPEEIL